MTSRVVRTQEELDKAIAEKVDWIEIRSEKGVWLEVTAYDSSTVTAYGSSTVRAYGSSTVTATSYVAVHLHDVTVHLTGGVVIDHTKVELFDAEEWCAYHGVSVENGIATVYKAVNDQWTTSRGFDYSPGALPSCTDFRDDASCGGGLHFGPTPTHALAYFREATKFVAVGVEVSALRPIVDRGATAKCKAPKVVRACAEVTIDGDLAEATQKEAA